MTKPIQTKMSDDGLRYSAKAPGSPFGGSVNTMSCFRCGRHRPAAQLQGERLLGRVQRVCRPSCEPLPSRATAAQPQRAAESPA